jgi:hypothetical protein
MEQAREALKKLNVFVSRQQRLAVDLAGFRGGGSAFWVRSRGIKYRCFGGLRHGESR